MPVLSKVRNAPIIPPFKKGTVWSGPCHHGPNGGVTFSMLSRFLQCRERFRLYVMEGLKPSDQFNHRIEYGNMWHVCEEQYAAWDRDPRVGTKWQDALHSYCQGLHKRYLMQQEEIVHWHIVCKVQFPLYIDYWQQHPDVVNRTPLFQEQVFDVLYPLPSGKKVRLRGKWDSVDLVGKDDDAGIYLQENKTKGQIIEEQLKRQLTFDLQTMIYLVAMEETQKVLKEDEPRSCLFKLQKYLGKIKGVRYNVIRRPLSGGKGTIVRHKPSKSNPEGESQEHFYARLKDYIAEEPETYFMRWKVEIIAEDIKKFKNQCLNPILEQLCEWWECVSGAKEKTLFNNEHGIHWRHPYGLSNILNEGGSSDLDHYLETGSEVGLQRTDQLFGELV